MQVPVILLTLMLFSSSAFANCVTNERGRVVCSNGSDAAGGYNSEDRHRLEIIEKREWSRYDTDEPGRRGQDQKWQGRI